MKYYNQPKFTNISVPYKPLDFKEIRKNYALFIGAGRSMTREMAILGTPTISVYRDDLLGVNKFSISKEVMYHEPNLTAGIVEN